MASASYYSSVPVNPNHNSQHHNPHWSNDSHHSGDIVDYSRLETPLKPLTMVTEQHGAYNGYGGFQDDHLEHVRREDERIKDRIRTLRVVSRILATLISLAVLIPITMTLIKFLTTRSIYRDVPIAGGETLSRTAWSLKTKSWPTYMYFGTASTSFTLNLLTLAGYLRNVKTANRFDTASTVFNSLLLAGNVVVWAIAATIYKREKEVVEDGKHNDLWGWTCSGPAHAIQEAFKDVVPFDTYCNIQSASWYAGLVHVGSTLLLLAVWLLMWRRMKSKKVVRTSIAQQSLIQQGAYR